jgi:hypothetical protein
MSRLGLPGEKWGEPSLEIVMGMPQSYHVFLRLDHARGFQERVSRKPRSARYSFGGISISIRSQRPSANASAERVGAAVAAQFEHYPSWRARHSDRPDYRGRLGSEIWNRSLTASLKFCLQPIYRSVVCTEACPSRNWICSSSPPALWQSRAQVRRRSCGAR